MKSFALNVSLKKAIFALAAVAAFLPMAAQSACVITGPVVRVSTYDDSFSSAGCWVYMRSSALASYYYRAASNDDNICTNAVIAATSGVDVQISANASSCPSSGTSRTMGTINYLAINP